MSIFSIKKLGVAAAAAAVISFGASTASAAPEHNWKVQSFWSPGSVNMKVFQRFAKNVGDMSNGRIKITPLPIGAVVGHTETLDAVAAGILQGHHSGGAYFAGKEPAFQICNELNGAFDNTYQHQLWFEHGGGLALCRELYAKFGAFYVGPVWFGGESMPSKNRLDTVASFKGVKMRSPEGMGASIWRRIGAGVVTLPGSEVFTALERGVIDATDWGTLGMNQDLGYHKIAPFPLYPGFHSAPASEIAINLGIWNKLPADLKAIMVFAVKEFSRDMKQTIEMVDLEAANQAEKQGITLVNWSKEERGKFRAIAMLEWEAWAKKSPMARKIVDSQVAFLRKLKLIN